MTFTPDIYAEIRDGAERSAAVLVPLVAEALRIPPRAAVIDVGCGEGAFTREFARWGCEALGIDETVSEFGTEQQIGEGLAWFRRVDLRAGLLPDRVYDLAVCLEVAEHLPPAYAPQLVADLCRLSPVVLFSAAVPGQGGHGHVNEQWPAYWADLFKANSYAVSGALRWPIWFDDRIEPWYRQNLLVAIGDADSARLAGIADDLFDRERGVVEPIPVVHPVTFSHIRSLYDEIARRG